MARSIITLVRTLVFSSVVFGAGAYANETRSLKDDGNPAIEQNQTGVYEIAHHGHAGVGDVYCESQGVQWKCSTSQDSELANRADYSQRASA